MRQNQNAAMGSARAQRGGSGFTSEGSGSQAEVAVADVWESAIGDAALSNAVSDANKRFAAESARYQGDLSMMAARSEADQYKMLSQNALGSAMVQTALTVSWGRQECPVAGCWGVLPRAGRRGVPPPEEPRGLFPG